MTWHELLWSDAYGLITYVAAAPVLRRAETALTNHRTTTTTTRGNS